MAVSLELYMDTAIATNNYGATFYRRLEYMATCSTFERKRVHHKDNSVSRILDDIRSEVLTCQKLDNTKSCTSLTSTEAIHQLGSHSVNLEDSYPATYDYTQHQQQCNSQTLGSPMASALAEATKCWKTHTIRRHTPCEVGQRWRPHNFEGHAIPEAKQYQQQRKLRKVGMRATT